MIHWVTIIRVRDGFKTIVAGSVDFDGAYYSFMRLRKGYEKKGLKFSETKLHKLSNPLLKIELTRSKAPATDVGRYNKKDWYLKNLYQRN